MRRKPNSVRARRASLNVASRFLRSSETQAVFELARAAHRRGRDRAVMAADEVHQTEIDDPQPRGGGDLPHVTQCPVGLDEDVHRDLA
jgi:hypothetical protein